jgi:hypothetical protein
MDEYKNKVKENGIIFEATKRDDQRANPMGIT